MCQEFIAVFMDTLLESYTLFVRKGPDYVHFQHHGEFKLIPCFVLVEGT